MRILVMTVLLLAMTITGAFGQTKRPATQTPMTSLSVSTRLGPIPGEILIRAPAVMTELRLTAAQNAMIGALARRFEKQGETLRRQIQTNREAQPGRDPSRVGSDYFEARKAQEQSMNQAIIDTLDPLQRGRFRELHLQAEGPAAFERPELCSRLNLTLDQIESIRSILREGRKKLGAAAAQVVLEPSTNAPAIKNRAKARAEAQATVRQAVSREITHVLTEVQLARYQRMLGEQFDFTR